MSHRGNPNLGAGSARVIVNQVVGGNASQLLGYTEVAGQRAEVVIANPPLLKILDVGAYREKRHSRDARQKLEIGLELIKGN